MRAESPDVIALQEVRHSWRDLPGHNQARSIAESLGYYWFYRPAHTFWPVPPLVEGLAFLSGAPMEYRAYSVKQLPWAGPHRIFLTATAPDVRIVNVHFPLTNRARDVAAEQLSAVVRHLGDGPTLAVGDFNADADQSPMKILRANGFVDLWAAEGNPAWPRKRRIDYALGFGLRNGQASVRTVGTTPIDGILPSDHPGLLVDLPLA